MNIMMNPTPPPSLSAGAPAEKAGGLSRPESSFAEYFDRRMNADHKKNLLGTGEVKKVENPAAPAPHAEGELEERQALAELLGQLMMELKNMSREDQVAPGEWVIPAVDGSVLDGIAAAAGLDEIARQDLLAGLSEGKSVELAALLDLLAAHFMAMADSVAVKAPDTELPFIESLLNGMGVHSEKLAAIAEMASNGDDQFDLAIYLEKLQALGAELRGSSEVQLAPISLTDWEREQFADLLARAGVSSEQITAIMPEGKGGELTLSFEKLADILAGAVSAVKDARARIELPEFLSELKSLLAMAGYAGKDGGWTPVVQETLENVYRDLVESVDLKGVKIRWNENPVQLGVNDETMENVVIDESGDGEEVLLPAERELVKDSAGPEKKGKGINAAQYNDKAAPEMLRNDENITVSGGGESGSKSGVGQLSEINRTAPLPRTLSELQQQAFEQISRGVMTGLRNNDHHLILKLYPPELGEVKVEMLVRNDQVAVSFSMENSRVKEALEAGMDQFRQNLEQGGFNLGECMVSVGGGNESDDAWQRFANEWRQQMASTREVAGSFSDLPDHAFYRREHYLGDHDGAISFLV
ncbi:MAG: flagellar hook-length control protein FliK [Proteobacteria bacterium]|nr:flagellar hook-length control protein FliK [Pseudomonadota bacterium]MBU1737342.1 flagellar hook-length control protein FliK [Pseudomonadota bacterium]